MEWTYDQVDERQRQDTTNHTFGLTARSLNLSCGELKGVRLERLIAFLLFVGRNYFLFFTIRPTISYQQ
jgi:hypothetical protein